MKTVKDIYDFFLNIPSDKESLSLGDFMETIDGYVEEEIKDGLQKCDWTLAQEYYNICEQMCKDLLLINVRPNKMICVANNYIAISSKCANCPEEFEQDLKYGVYDFKYRGFVYTRDYFTKSVLQIESQHIDGRLDTGTAYYIGNNKFVTAAHCINDPVRFNLLLPDGRPLTLKEVWLAKGKDLEVFDLAIIHIDEKISIPAFKLGTPVILDDVLVMGFPPIANLPAIQVAETATIGAYQKASTGQVVANTTAYRTGMDYFLINARVKGGNSGGPVINKEGKIVGTVVSLPYDINSDPTNPRYDIMGYGQCLPSKYIEELLSSPECFPLHSEDRFYSFR